MHHTTPSRSPHNALHSPSIFIFLYIYMYIWYVRIPYMHSALFVRDAIFLHVSYMSEDIAKLATFESQKEVVYTTHLWSPKKEGEKG